MINNILHNKIGEIIKIPNIIITKGKIGGQSIEIYIEEPKYEDIGSFIYNTEEERDLDYNELTSLL